VGLGGPSGSFKWARNFEGHGKTNGKVGGISRRTIGRGVSRVWTKAYVLTINRQNYPNPKTQSGKKAQKRYKGNSWRTRKRQRRPRVGGEQGGQKKKPKRACGAIDTNLNKEPTRGRCFLPARCRVTSVTQETRKLALKRLGKRPKHGGPDRNVEVVTVKIRWIR